MKRLVIVGALVGAFAATSAWAQGTSAKTTSLGTVRIAHKVMADGKALTPGTYTIRLTDESPKPGVGQSPDAERYVEIVKGGSVVARVVATVISADEIDKVAKGRKPARNASSAELLKGGDYYRVWINRGGTNYLINLPTGA